MMRRAGTGLLDDARADGLVILDEQDGCHVHLTGHRKVRYD